MNQLYPDDARRYIDQSQELNQANVLASGIDRPFEIQVYPSIALTTALDRTQAQRISSAFKTLYVSDATDTSTYIYFLPMTNDSLQSPLKLKLGDALNFEKQVPGGYIYWDAQSGKTIELTLFYSGDFRSGSIRSVNAGGVTINFGSSISTAQVALAAASATQIFASDTSRKSATIQNTSGASIWVGPSTVTNSGANIGLEVAPGASLEFQNTAALYAYSVAGGNIMYIKES